MALYLKPRLKGGMLRINLRTLSIEQRRKQEKTASVGEGNWEREKRAGKELCQLHSKGRYRVVLL